MDIASTSAAISGILRLDSGSGSARSGNVEFCGEFAGDVKVAVVGSLGLEGGASTFSEGGIALVHLW